MAGDPPRKRLLDMVRPEGGTGFPLLDAVLDRVPDVVDDARKQARGHVVNRVVGDVVQDRLDAVMAARRRLR